MFPVPSPAASATPTPVRDTLGEPAETIVMRPGFDRILLKVRRNQTTSVTKKVGFSIHVIAELSPEARAAVNKYRLGKVILFQKDLELKVTKSFLLALWRFIVLFFTRRRWQITVNDLVQGRTLTARDVIEMLSTEDEIKKAANVFADVLRAASWFGGEEVIEL